MTVFQSRKKRFVQAGALALTAALITGVAAQGPRIAEASVYSGEKDARAGVVGELGEFQAKAYATSLTLADSGLSVVAADENDAEAADSSDTEAADTAKKEGTADAEKADEWASRTVANVETSMNVRGSAGEDGSIVGCLRRGDVAEVVSRADGWTEIRSGNVHGFVSDAYLLFGAEAEELADSITPLTATSTTDGLRVRGDASTDAGVISQLDSGEALAADASYDMAGGWVKVSVNGKEGYVNADYVTVERKYPVAVTVEEQQAIDAAAAKKAAEEAKAKAAAEEAAAAKKASSNQKAYDGSSTQNAAVEVSVDDTTLLAGIIYCEAGNQPYEGQVAVGAVVMNRVRSGRYPSTIHDVIYQRSQFGPAGSGKLARAIADGSYKKCLSAAQDALAGTDPTNGAIGFKSTRSGHSGVVIGAHVFF